ncbi:MAG: uroporphyrinogen-III synthase [Alphaproteobacteria bacterium]
MSRKIIITRPIEQGKIFVDTLNTRLGMKAEDFILCPVMTIIHDMANIPSSDSYDALILTSVHAVHSVRDNHEVLSKPCYVVGQACGDAFEKAGGTNIVSITSTVHDLVKVIEKSHNQSFLYIRGRDISLDIKEVLKPLGKNVDEAISYNAQENDQMSSDVVTEILKHRIGAVTLFSKRTAHLFYTYIKQAELTSHLEGANILCLSNAIAQFVSEVQGKNASDHVYVAQTPDMQGMIDLIDRFGVA